MDKPMIERPQHPAMTETQRDRIRAACKELSGALTDAGGEFSVNLRSVELTLISDTHRTFQYWIDCVSTNTESIS